MQSTNQKIKNAILNSFLDKNTFEQNDEYAAKLIANTKDETMYNRILDEVQHCKSFTFAVAFIESGILNSLKTVLKDLNVQGRILTSTYLYFNKPQMFRELLKLPNVEIRVYEQNHGKFHAKGYLFQHEGYQSALVGSSNFTAGALKVNKEWNLLFTSHNNGKLTEDIASEIEEQWIGVSDYTYNGEVIDDNTNLKYLVSEERVKYVVEQSKYYGYDGDVLHGLVFVSRKEEADEIAKLLTKNGYPSQMLSGEDSQEQREQAIEKLKNGELTYLVTVDIFNEGIDIPFINQVIMMRKTESVIVFVQQLGRGLRKAQGKEYLTVIDFIGNYKNNYLIPVALTGDQSRTREGIREHVETGQIEGLSTINFELVAKKRILKQLRGKKNLFTLEIKKDYQELKRRLNKTPLIADFIKNNMVASQAILSILNKKGNYNDFLLRVDKDAAYSWENDYLDKTLTFITSEFLSGKRIHELLLLQKLLDNGVSSRSELEKLVVDNGSYCNDDVLDSVERILTLEYYKPKSYDNKNDKEKNKTEFAKLGGQALIEISNNKEYRFNKEISELLESDPGFKNLFVDVIKAGLLNARKYDKKNIFTIEKRYTRSDVNRLLNWQRKIPAQSIGGYFIENGYCPIFVTYVKSNDIDDSIKYEDRFISNSKIHCYTKNGRKLGQGETLKMFAGVSEGNPQLTYLLFVKRSDAEDDDEFVYLGTGKVTADSLKQEYREIDKKGKLVNTPIVSYDLKLDTPISLTRYRMLTEGSNE